tara:strand:- start:1038 stop:1871 length:834 start_codon:yes stop_codon:yes gene_type:complete
LFTYIDSIEDLSFLDEELMQKPLLGVDTEFRRTTKDNMRLALLQINDGEEIYLIDTVLIDEPNGSCNFLFSKSVKKIFHSCKEDLEAINSWTGGIMVNLFDTQLANAFLNGHYSISYQGIVKEKLDITVDKKETRSNWIRRPLSDSQLNYAASDVEYLIHLFTDQEYELTKSGKMNWLEEEIEHLISATFNSNIEDNEIESSLSKSEEKNLIHKFNEIIIQISQVEKINPTLLFSKKNQKEFLRSSLKYGIQEASKDITIWRRDLIVDPLKNILLGY